MTNKKEISQEALKQLEELAAGVSTTGGCAEWMDGLDTRVKALIITALQRRTVSEVHRFITSWDGPQFPYTVWTLRSYVRANKSSWDNQNNAIYRGGDL